MLGSPGMPVDPQFRVVAVGLQVPPYPGHSMDPPLRSRFQSKHIDNLGANSVVDILQNRGAAIEASTNSSNQKQMSKVVGLYETLREQKSIALKEGVTLGGLPSLNVKQMEYCLGLNQVNKQMNNQAKNANNAQAGQGQGQEKKRDRKGTQQGQGQGQGQRLKPEEVVARVERCMPALTWMQSSVHQRLRPLLASAWDNLTSDCHIKTHGATLSTLSDPATATTSTGGSEKGTGNVHLTDNQSRVLAALEEDLAANRHLCVLGSKGSGKSVIARAFALRNDLHTNMFPLYAELTARDLLQRRVTNIAGGTDWADR